MSDTHSWRSAAKGTYFIQSVCRVLTERPSIEIEDLRRKVAKEMGENQEQDVKGGLVPEASHHAGKEVQVQEEERGGTQGGRRGRTTTATTRYVLDAKAGSLRKRKERRIKIVHNELINQRIQIDLMNTANVL